MCHANLAIWKSLNGRTALLYGDHEQLSRLAPQNEKPKSPKKSSTRSGARRRNTRKRSRKPWDNEELKQELENEKMSKEQEQKVQDDNALRAKTRVHFHKILIGSFDNHQSQTSSSNVNDRHERSRDDLNYLCNELEDAIYFKNHEEIGKDYMALSRNLIFNLKKNRELQDKLVRKEITVHQFVSMDYTQLAAEPLTKKRKLHQKKELEKMKEVANEQESDDWIECAVECSNCNATTCKYARHNKLYVESTKSAVFCSASSKQDMVSMLCSNCGFTFSHEICLN